MFYIFNSNEKIVGWCEYSPDLEDLNSRNEFCIEFRETIKDPRKLVVGKYKTLFEPAPSEKTQEQLIQEQTSLVLSERYKALSSLDWVVNRHIEQKMLNISTSLSDEEFNQYLKYRQSLRDITSDIKFPFIELPAPPKIIK